MTRFRKVLAIPGNEVTRINQQLAQPPDSPAGTYLGEEEYAFEFDNGFTIQVQAVMRAPGDAELCAYLYNQAGDCIEERRRIENGIDQDYVFVANTHDTYTGVIVRGVNNACSNEDIANYIASGVSCLFCSADDLHGGPINVIGVEASQEIYCPACNSTWVNIMRLAEVRNLQPGEPGH